MTAEIYDPRPCQLGEGAFWHPERQQFFWFDILQRRLLSRDATGPLDWRFDRMVSAAGWVDRDTLLISTEHGLSTFDLQSGQLDTIADIEADQPGTRCNDGRSDRQGGFWFSTMGKSAEAEAGAIYRYYRGEIRQLFSNVTIPNAICFSPAGDIAYFADTDRQQVYRQGLNAAGWPEGERQIFLDLSATEFYPDGAIIDAEGHMLCAIWGQGAVHRYSPSGQLVAVLKIGGLHASCPCLGGSDLGDLLVTTAQQGMTNPDAAQGLPYLLRPGIKGLADAKVIL